MTIEEIKRMADDMPVLDLQVTVEQVYKRRNGVGKYGEWSFQDIKIKDSTGDIFVKCGNKEPLDYLKGQQVTLTCVKNDKIGWTGLKIIDDSYEKDGKLIEIRKLEMTETGVIIQKASVGTTAFNTQPEPKPEPQKENEYWDGVNMRICRQNALGNALKFYEKSTVFISKEEVINLAEEFAFWTFYGKKGEPF